MTLSSILLSTAIALSTLTAHPAIVGRGSCGGPAYGPGVYVFFFDAVSDPHGAKVDITAHQIAWQPDWSPSWAILGAAFAVPSDGFAVTTNVSHTLFVRWTGTTAPVYRIDAQPCRYSMHRRGHRP